MKNFSMADGLAAGGGIALWERAFNSLMPHIRTFLPRESNILEIGYGDGKLSCFLARELDWLMTGIDISPVCCDAARINAEGAGLKDRVTFHCGHPFVNPPESAKFDGVFIKTVLYQASNLMEYRSWLQWIGLTLKSGGYFINFETGKAGMLMKLYRTLRGREYTDSLLFHGSVLSLYREEFEVRNELYLGGWSQFLSPFPRLYRWASSIEEKSRRRTSDNCFLASLILQKRV
jgi:ubiquinone/menaquinone biosynthesis C-methylase UbiE